jgi:alpha-methylacyl-CoA racemase
MERLGLGPEICCRRNPRLVYARLTGWGQDGPLAQRAGHDLTYLALSGVLGATGPAGGPPQVPGVTVADLAGGGMTTVIGVLSALAERQHSGVGQVVDAAMVDGSALLAAFPIGLRAAGLLERPAGENLLDGGAPFYASYPCADGEYLAVGPLEPAFYAEFLNGLGLADEELPAQYDTTGWPVLRRRFAEVIARHPRRHWEQVFEGTDACVAPVLRPWEAHRHPHASARGAFVEVAGVVQPAPAPRFSRTPAASPGRAGCPVAIHR